MLTGDWLMSTLSLDKSSLLAVDAQQGFTTLCPEELPVPGGLDIVPQVNRLLALSWRRIDASQDWHPPDHCSFFGQRENLYPPHCVMGTPGAEFLPGLASRRFQTIWGKGFQRDMDAYAITAQHPAFVDLLRASGVALGGGLWTGDEHLLFLCGAGPAQAGFDVALVEDASAGIDVPAAGLFQERTRTEGLNLGIRYVSTVAVMASVR